MKESKERKKNILFAIISTCFVLFFVFGAFIGELFFPISYKLNLLFGGLFSIDVILTFVFSIIYLKKYKKEAFPIVTLIFSAMLFFVLIIRIIRGVSF